MFRENSLHCIDDGDKNKFQLYTPIAKELSDVLAQHEENENDRLWREVKAFERIEKFLESWVNQSTKQENQSLAKKNRTELESLPEQFTSFGKEKN